MLKIGKDGLIVDSADDRPVAVFVDSFVTSLGAEAQSQLVIFRLHHKDWPKSGPMVPHAQIHQFALPAHRAAELGRQLLELAAQAEKEAHPRPPH
jgi:hypothetical protein